MELLFREGIVTRDSIESLKAVLNDLQAQIDELKPKNAEPKTEQWRETNIVNQPSFPAPKTPEPEPVKKK